MLIYFNGKLVKKEDAKVSVFDHGLLYGDGVFEGIRSYDCLVFKLREHIDRLYASAQGISLKIPMQKREMEKAIVGTLKANKLKDAYIRVVVTRGEGDLGLDPRNCRHATVFIITDKIALYAAELYHKGLKIVTVPTRRNIPEALNPQIKSLNYLNNILGKIEAINAGVPEALMLDQNGFVTECTGDNIFMIKDDVLVTPPVSVGVLNGITRGAVLEVAAKAGLKTCERMVTRFELYVADEMFLTGTAAELIPVVMIDGRLIGAGNVGKHTSALIGVFKKITKKDGVRYAL
ncbi:D-alanine/D-glutamate or branched-chain amino acid aminotransferase [Candidatus Velamenicoccus archaeovorus]|uniref:Branched-chain-amino-acid aminotransferase n=1 Tax=Velamenicoccus archaeovorus TaxID=1930593 RepID=A0A410P567_VELA1|nr:branched-chain-amino-acid transaminase [Candidatus Velamenicoccus archaeovorus]QAT17347.1 D-alanine/D-glutamate or branched-chain amino acid aminotransferase [Candidatus Velamenicoccus archaeovorus]